MTKWWIGAINKLPDRVFFLSIRQFILHTGKTCNESRLQTASKVLLPVALL